MAVDSNGVLVAPLNPQNLYRFFGIKKRANGYDIGYLCSNRHGKINKWAQYKPIEAPRYPTIPQDDTERQLAAWGFHWWNQDRNDENAPFALSAAALYEKAKKHNFDWPYKGALTSFRISDFDGYNHLAQQPYIKTNDRTLIGLPSSSVEFDVYVDLADTRNQLYASMFPNIANMSTPISSFKIAAILADNDVAVSTAISDYTIADVDAGTVASVRLGASAPKRRDEVYEYRALMAATNRGIEEDGDGTIWMYLPKTVSSVKVTAGGIIPEYYADGSVDFGILFTDIEGNLVKDDSTTVDKMELDLSFFNMEEVSLEVGYYLTLWNTVDGYSNSQGVYPIGPDTLSIYASGRINELDKIINIAEAVGDYAPSQIKMTLTYYYAFEETRIYRHFDFINEVYEKDIATESDGVTLLEIINKRIEDGMYGDGAM